MWYKLLKRAHRGLPKEVEHMLTGPFALIAAQDDRLESSPNGHHENMMRERQLQTVIQEKGYGYYPNNGLYLNEELKARVPQKAVFVIGIPEVETQKLAVAFKQESYIWGNQGYFWLKSTAGEVWMEGRVADYFQELPQDTQLDHSEVKGKNWRFAPPEQQNESSPGR